MININDLKQNLHFLANKSQTGASITPDDFNRQIVFAVYYVIRRILGLPEEYNAQMPLTQMGYEKTQLITDYLNELKIPNKRLKVNSAGMATFPTDYLYIADLYTYYQQSGTNERYDILQNPNIEAIPVKCEVEPIDPCDTNIATPFKPAATLEAQSLMSYKIRSAVEVVTSDVYTSRQQHSVRIPTLEYPIANFAGTGKLECAPQNIGWVYVTYIKRPAKAFWGYTIDPTTLQVTYDPLTSVDIPLPEELTDMVTANMLVRLGYSVRETELQQIATKVNATGS